MAELSNRLTALLGIEHPIIQEGMGPFKTNRIAAAASAAGGLGTVSMPGMTKDPKVGSRLLRENIEQVASLTDRPFAVNVPVGRDDTGTVLPVSEAYIRAAVEARNSDSALSRQLVALTTSAGFPGEFRALIRDAGLIHMHKVGSTKHARKAEDAGVDVVIASGYEMGGHTHATPMHTFVLVPNVTEAVSVPVVLSGGARDGRTLAAALALGASGVAMGTRFIATEDNTDWHASYAQKIIEADEGDDTVFPAVYGPARGLHNAGVDRLLEIVRTNEMSHDELTRWKDEALIRAQEDGDVENGVMPAGQVASGIHDLVAIGEFVPRMAAEAADILRRLAGVGQPVH
ncbi:NAD(P)H-dependent flavin oxidoreductase [Pseudonocardia acidicola]|uniref:Nitronate monooxygenase n=1 Tax=Pseudonocardia acidicola TaxID=2724939 RepID=A0ABX1SJ68_9PSEU|nr:nitronate monooxygenase family protein [Pseudonocardia acidicola]NMI00184.1 nitronate monooxygenase [Pseudonocardia acidicola]